MDQQQQPLDIVDIQEDLTYDLASGGQRFANYLIDTVVLQGAYYGLIAAFPYAGFFAGPVSSFVVLMIATFVYYSLLEYATGKTIGKWITGTNVLREADLGKISVSQALGRTLCRLVPFEPFSFFGSNKGWHDSWTNTIVIKSNSLRK